MAYPVPGPFLRFTAVYGSKHAWFAGSVHPFRVMSPGSACAAGAFPVTASVAARSMVAATTSSRFANVPEDGQEMCFIGTCLTWCWDGAGTWSAPPRPRQTAGDRRRGESCLLSIAGHIAGHLGGSIVFIRVRSQ